MLDKLEDRLGKQKATVSSKQTAYVQAMKARVAREEAERLANRIPRAEAHFNELKSAITVQIARFARVRKGRPGIESLKPFPVAREFDGFKEGFPGVGGRHGGGARGTARNGSLHARGASCQARCGASGWDKDLSQPPGGGRAGGAWASRRSTVWIKFR